MSTFKSLQEINIENIEVGDLLEIKRGGFEHWAVYIGNNEVVHLTGVDDGERANKGKHFIISGTKYNKAAVIRESVSNAVGQDRVRVNKEGDKKYR
uniref:LRAT domain-containing protein n=1 Tax=Magallana gigas TaxID=29159 RepID=A0A8W8NSX0_MAGGI